MHLALWVFLLCVKSHNDRMVNPIVKWAGGKRKQAAKIVDSFPSHNTYREPFLGGGAVFLEAASRGLATQAVLSDSLPCLINAYRCIAKIQKRSIVDAQLEGWSIDYSSRVDEDDRRVMYNTIRDDFNSSMLTIVQAARFLFLNRTCFNGLFRLNAKGDFNVPFGKYEKPAIHRPLEHKAFARLLRPQTLSCCDFSESIKDAVKGDLIYCDPPYWPINGGFTSYTADKFGEAQQVYLAELLSAATKRGVKWAASNHDFPEVRALYRSGAGKGVHFQSMEGRRNINRDGAGREPIAEILITNY